MVMEYVEFLGRLAPIISALVAVVSFAMGWIISARNHIAAKEKQLAERQEAICKGLLALIRSQIVDDYEHYVVRGAPLTVERRHEMDRAFDAYKALGGNGTIGHLYEEIKKVPTYIAESERKK